MQKETSQEHTTVTSIGLMIKNLGRLINNRSLSMDRLTLKFIDDMLAHTNNGSETRHLADFQTRWIAQLHHDYQITISEDQRIYPPADCAQGSAQTTAG